MRRGELNEVQHLREVESEKRAPALTPLLFGADDGGQPVVRHRFGVRKQQGVDDEKQPRQRGQTPSPSEAGDDQY
ncbi:hypothetical protein [Natrinema sp. SYSU A 869]|uniref:hypothetical protein n=1 Tax=Natrinema sp. SYSU A 869 TaxID=2871694 RepID=UPI001CA45BDB|nr:hypothetical protein [Natrinema sp. SYSU A 869]